MTRSSNEKPRTVPLSALAPGDVVLYLGVQWRVQGFLLPYAGMPGRELRCIEGKGKGVTAKIHESDEISTRFELVGRVAA